MNYLAGYRLTAQVQLCSPKSVTVKLA